MRTTYFNDIVDYVIIYLLWFSILTFFNLGRLKTFSGRNFNLVGTFERSKLKIPNSFRKRLENPKIGGGSVNFTQN